MNDNTVNKNRGVVVSQSLSRFHVEIDSVKKKWTFGPTKYKKCSTSLSLKRYYFSSYYC